MKGWKRLKHCGNTRLRVYNLHTLRELRKFCKEYRFLKSQYRIFIPGGKRRFLMLKKARTMMTNGMWERGTQEMKL